MIKLHAESYVPVAINKRRGQEGSAHGPIDEWYAVDPKGASADLARLGGDVKKYHRMISCLIGKHGAQRAGWIMSRCRTSGKRVWVRNWRY